LRSCARDGWALFAMAWRPQLLKGETDEASIHACFDRTRELLGVDLECTFCPHPPGPPVCWCRKPLPGLVIEFSVRRSISLQNSIMVGRSAADRTMAERLHVQYFDHAQWFA